MTGLALIGHGSRKNLGNEEVFALAERLRALHSGPVTVGFIELAEPSAEAALDAAVEAGAATVIALPAVLLAAAHAKNDVPMAVTRARLRHPNVRFEAAQPVGVDADIVAALGERLADAMPADLASGEVAVLLVGRGSSDPDANADLAKLARLLAEGRGFITVDPAFIGVTTPSPETVFGLLRARRPRAVVVLPFLLYPGVLLMRLREQFSSLAVMSSRMVVVVAEPIGTHPAIEATLLRRAREALAGEARGSCDTCKYRAPMAGFARDVGGERALRKARAHLELPTNAPPHAHLPPVRHVLVCVNRDCAERGAIETLSAIRTELRAAQAERIVRTTRVMCLGRCGDGPAVVVYPDGVWYRGVAASDAAELTSSHLLAGSPVGRLIDQLIG
jgi:sirohydrochlorin ferrochelatase/(2Fe-2S) ferredoxin